MKVTFFIDFDGTITKKDTCIAMSNAFCRKDWHDINLKWQEGEISTAESAQQIFELLEVSKEQLKTFLQREIQIDDYFKDFLDLCDEGSHEVYILSDGYDFNIKTILFEKYGLKNIPFYSNKLIFLENQLEFESKYGSKSCFRCGTCKSNLMEKLRSKDDRAIYIGDGYSDMCAAKNADIVFAKKDLLKYCRENDIPAIAFDDFSDVMDWIKSNINQ
ncbi:MAG TPA: MtnX-like HAD-IB family phosphatase [Bacilli bacterium]|nr:MtnX-like HAD-IB family phosphatase [Bacilli bacterium]